MKTLLEKERLTRNRVDALNKIKHDRMKRFKRLTEMEIALCRSLGSESELGEKFQTQFVPSEEDLQGFRKRVEVLESTKVSYFVLITCSHLLPSIRTLGKWSFVILEKKLLAYGQN